MARCILTGAACVVGVVVVVGGASHGADHRFVIRDQATLDEFLAAEINAGDRVELDLGGYLFDLHGSFTGDTARVTGVASFFQPHTTDVPID